MATAASATVESTAILLRMLHILPVSALARAGSLGGNQ